MSHNNFPEFLRDPDKLSSDEFCQKLCQWFKEQGLMAELRAHLRALLITALKGSALGPQPPLKAVSPKVQSLNLLIAEFLMQQHYHYSLSVFTSEAPLQEFSAFAGGSSRSAPTTRPVFLLRDVQDILQSLGLPPDSEESIRISRLYQDNEDRDSLLTCIFRILPAFTCTPHVDQRKIKNNVTEEVARVEESDKNILTTKSSKQDLEWTGEMFNTEIPKILTQCNMKMEHAQQLQDQLKRFLELEVSRVRKEEEVKYQQELVSRETNIQISLKQRDGLFRHLIDESQTRIEHEKNYVKKSRQEMNEIAIDMRRSHEQMSKRFSALEEWGEALRAKELELQELKHREALQLTEKKSQLQLQQRQLDMELKRLHEEQEDLYAMKQQAMEVNKGLQEARQSESEESPMILRLQQECATLRRKLESTRHLLRIQSAENVNEERSKQKNEVGVNDVSQFQQALVATEISRQLQTENCELHARIRQQGRRIEELTSRAARLVLELEDANTAITLLSRSEFQRNGLSNPNSREMVVPRPPPPPPPLPPQEFHEAGAGEVSYVEREQLQSTPQRTPASTRRKAPKRLVVYNQSSSEEGSPTEEMLQEARRRLRTLEEESEAVDKRFWEFRQKQADILGASTSNTFHPPSVPSTYPSLPQQHKRNQMPASYSFHSQYETSLPSYTRLNHRPSLYQQVVEASTHSRTSRMTDLFHSSSSDSASPYVFPNQTSKIRGLDSQDNSISQFRFLAGNISHDRHPSAPTVTPPAFSSPSMQYSPASSHLYNNLMQPNIGLVTTGMGTTSVYISPQVSYFAENSQATPQIKLAKTDEKHNQENHVLDGTLEEIQVPVEKVKKKSSKVHFASEECSLLFANASTGTPQISPCPSELSCPSVESVTQVSDSLPPLSIIPTLSEIAREGEQLLVPLARPDCQLEASGVVDALSNMPVEEPKNDEERSKLLSNITPVDALNNLHNSTALQVHLSGIGSLPQLENISISSIEVSSEQPISVAGDDGRGEESDDDFYS